MGVREELIACGGTPVGAPFNQTQFKNVGGVDANRIADGYCAGVVMDWTRRVLQSAPDRDSNYLSYSKPDYEVSSVAQLGDQQTPLRPGLSRQAATVNRMAKAYERQGTSYVAQTKLQKVKAALRHLQQNGVEETGARGTGVPIPNELGVLLDDFWQFGNPNSTFERFDLGKVTAGWIPLNRFPALLNDLDQRDDPQHEVRAAGGRHWATTAAELDEEFRQIRISESRQVSSKPFGNLRVIRSDPSKPYSSGGAWMAELLRNGLLNGCCTSLSFKPTSGGSGHQVAVHQTDTDTYRFFDPNYGVFEYSRDGLQGCFQQLFWDAWQPVDPNAVDREKAVYLRREKTTDPEIGTWNRMGYTIFGLQDG